MSPAAAIDSSPRRVTRGKAARAKTAPTSSFMAGTRSTAAKRKTRADDKDDEDLAKREAAAKRPRGGVVVGVAKPDKDVKKPAVVAKATRGRPKKVAVTAAPEPPARVSRSSSSTSLTRPKTTTTITTTAAKSTTKTMAGPPVKKAVKFQEPDKENAGVLEKPEKPAATGLRGRPARRGGAALARANGRATSKTPSALSSSSSTTTTTTTTSTTGPSDRKPLSALKKMTQNFTTWEESDDELAREKTPIKPLMKSPIKPPTAKKATAVDPETDADNATSAAIFGPLNVNAVSLGSPIRPPQSPLGDGLRSPAKRIPALGSALKPTSADQGKCSQSPLKPNTNLLQSAAKRPASPIKGLKLHSAQDLAAIESSSSKPFMFHSPAKRAMPGLKPVAEPLSAGVSTLRAYPALKPLPTSYSAKPSQKLLHEVDMNGDVDGDDVFTGPMESLRFPGRLSKALPQDVTPGPDETDEAEEQGGTLAMGQVAPAGDDALEKDGDGDDDDAGDEDEVDRDNTLSEIEGPVVLEQTAEPQLEESPPKALSPKNLSPTALSPEALSPKGMSPKEMSPQVPSPKESSPRVSSPQDQDLTPRESPTKVPSPRGSSPEERRPRKRSPVVSPPKELSPIETFAEESMDEPPNALYELREKDQDPCHDMSTLSGLDGEDDTLRFDQVCATPNTNFPTSAASRRIASCVSKSGRRTTLGFSSLADQLGAWSAASPVKAPHTTRKTRSATTVHDEDADSNADSNADVEADADTDAEANVDADRVATRADSPMSDGSCEDEMPASNFTPPATSLPSVQETEEKDEPIIFNDISFTEEDKALVQEANDMCLSEVDARGPIDAGLSDASQEYADENQTTAIPVEARDELPPMAVTPVRPMTRSFHTTTKVPLKPSDDSSPSPLKKRSFSASRAAPKRPSSLSKVTMPPAHATPERRRSPRKQPTIREETAPNTPAKTDESWSAAETPGRTPRKDVNPTLLRGAIVFVDVHTSEGGDASGIFIELLTHMGARCVKGWNWTPPEGSTSSSSASSSSSSSKKVGITHVVFKDGSKRTLEKVREANGVVQCVGVSWVLDCERANEWRDESLYSIDTSNVPRGGARRRKSMEPKALAGKDGTPVSGPSRRKSGRESLGASPCTPRRQSTIWMPTFSTPNEDEEGGEDVEGSSTFLTPVPKTPAPEAIARFAAETPSDGYEDEEGDTVSPLKDEMLMRTCPPKQRFREAGGGILGLHESLTQDEDVRMRLMAARRKSLQFAPKVGSPLAKMWR